MKLADFFASTSPGIPLSAAETHVGALDHLVRVSWPGVVCEPGWWWVICEIDGTMLVGGFATGQRRDRDHDIAARLAKVLHGREAVLAC